MPATLIGFIDWCAGPHIMIEFAHSVNGSYRFWLALLGRYTLALNYPLLTATGNSI